MGRRDHSGCAGADELRREAGTGTAYGHRAADVAVEAEHSRGDRARVGLALALRAGVSELRTASSSARSASGSVWVLAVSRQAAGEDLLASPFRQEGEDALARTARVQGEPAAPVPRSSSPREC